MREPSQNDTTPPILTRLSENPAAREFHDFIEEVRAYDDALRASDPHAAHAALTQRSLEIEPLFDEIRGAVMLKLLTKMHRVTEAEKGKAAGDLTAPGAPDQRGLWDGDPLYGPDDAAREAAFKRDPGRWLPGATPSATTLFRGEGCWLVERGDRILLATYAVLSCAQSDADECHEKAVDDGWGGIVVVGPPGLAKVARVPHGAAETGITVEFVEVDLGTAPTSGRAA
ncbi:hypothetical protein LPC10_17760 [Methylorubrum sp. B1-46]|uniref:hypothetical protein n=1 Tax=Methylorubrum TaxID=2282523 RepID=UPI001E35EDED|nr:MULTISPECIES: hypothetical protein [Methylorubrum]MCG5246861.1 hypothetical protein [Methylorubrum extorquens]UGB24777.1 hypothetical protein LPC10_17760 [Methylorubrum sp. B1-46]